MFPNSTMKTSSIMKNSSKLSSNSPLNRWKRSGLEKTHKCSLDLGSESMLPKQEIGSSKLCRNLKKLTLIAVCHPESFRCFISYPGILAERQRQLLAGGKYVIHPFSILSIIWKSFMILVIFSHMVVSPMRLCYILETRPWTQLHIMDHVLLMLHAICFLDLAMRFNIGFQEERHASNVVMARKRIACRYLCCWFFADLISCLPISYVMLTAHLRHVYLLGPHLLPFIRFGRICTVLHDLKIFMKTFTRNYIWHRLMRHGLVFAVTMHWCCCAIYLPPVGSYYVNGEISKGYCTFIKAHGGDLLNVTVWDRYQKAVVICFAAVFGTGYSLFQASLSEEIVIHSAIILYAAIFMVYNLAFLLKIYMTKYNSTMRYQELMNQVEIYMRHKQFPAQLKKRVRAFYNYRYEERYYKEETALECLSEQLRNEISLHTCHKLVNKVALFEGLPASVVGTILGCLKPDVFMPNDLVVRGGDIGDCMYFISTGTVAVYSLKGYEVCHLEDGAHFGEVALLMRDSKRVATVVAVEVTQVYRLDAADFREFIMSYRELYERVQALAAKRMHETVLLDEAYRTPSNAA